MDFTYDDEQLALREAVRGLLATHYADHDARRRTVAEDPGFDEKLEVFGRDSEVWDMAQVYAVQSVIRPEQTRDYLIRMLEVHRLRLTHGIGQRLMRAWPTSY